MAKITKVSAQKKVGRYNIFLDGQYSFSVSDKTLAEFRLFQNTELTDAEIKKIKQFDLDAQASDLAAKYLSYQPRTIHEVQIYLQKQDVAQGAIDAAIKQMQELGYLDDEKYAALFIKNDLQVGKDGSYNIAQKLRQKGVKTDIIEEAINQVEDEQWAQVGYKLVKNMVLKQNKLSLRELTRKIKTKLMSHGFSSVISDLVIDMLDLQEEDDAQLEALKVQGIKAYKKFKKYDDPIKRIKITQYLITHGFNSTEASSFLDGDVIPLEELDEY